MIYLLDTNILIYMIKNRPPEVGERVRALPTEDALAMSFVSYAELLMGAQKSTRKDQVLQQLERLTQNVVVRYPDSSAICHHYAEQFTRLKVTGQPIGANDLWIACHALSEAATLVTNNTREFRRVSGLRIENWADAQR